MNKIAINPHSYVFTEKGFIKAYELCKGEVVSPFKFTLETCPVQVYELPGRLRKFYAIEDTAIMQSTPTGFVKAPMSSTGQLLYKIKATKFDGDSSNNLNRPFKEKVEIVKDLLSGFAVESYTEPMLEELQSFFDSIGVMTDVRVLKEKYPNISSQEEFLNFAHFFQSSEDWSCCGITMKDLNNPVRVGSSVKYELAMQTKNASLAQKLQKVARWDYALSSELSQEVYRDPNLRNLYGVKLSESTMSVLPMYLYTEELQVVVCSLPYNENILVDNFIL